MPSWFENLTPADEAGRQFFISNKDVAIPFKIVPYENGFLLSASYRVGPTLSKGTIFFIPAEDLPDAIRTAYNNDKFRRETAQEEEKLRRDMKALPEPRESKSGIDIGEI